ncbi:MAG TPA: hypothetical protein PLV68_03055 [Ilumatobacteraceae bacterium]|nr:hypothetical protein [Ilumatobacteraceae bacterium]
MGLYWRDCFARPAKRGRDRDRVEGGVQPSGLVVQANATIGRPPADDHQLLAGRDLLEAIGRRYSCLVLRSIGFIDLDLTAVLHEVGDHLIRR